jgi:hypothetical protein
MTSVVPWIDGKPQIFLKPTSTSTQSSPSRHYISFLHTTLITNKNSCNTTCIVDLPIAKIHSNVGTHLHEQVYKVKKQHGFLWEQ